MARFAEAQTSYQKAVDLNDGNKNTHYGLGITYVEQKNLVMERTQYAALLLLDKDLAAKLMAKIDAAAPKGQ